MEGKIVYCAVPSCGSENNKHTLVACASPFYLKCEVCGTRFALVSEGVLNKLGIKIYQRPLTRQ